MTGEMICSRRRALQGLAVAGTSLLGGCAVNPVTGKRELMLMSVEQEIALGKQSHAEICASYGVYSDKNLQTWFTQKGTAMARVTPRQNLPYTFTVLDSPVVNAFAVPGGYVYITRGIMGYFNDEAEFAGVLGHELGHVEARHSASQYSKLQVTNLAINAGSILSETFSRYASLVSVGSTLMFLKFSRDDERLADRLGVEYSSKVGYDATRMSDFFVTLERMQPSDGSLPAWASTHPDPGDRIVATKKMALDFQKANPNVQYVTRRNEYLEMVDGLPHGDDPRQGYVRNGFFYHPGLKFMFPVPSGWKLSNQPSEVRLSPEKENATLVFKLGQGTNLIDGSTKFASANNITLSDSKQITVNGLQGLATVGELTSNGQTLSIASYYILMNNATYSFHGLAPSDGFSTVRQFFNQTATGFKPLTDKALISVTPNTIKVRSAAKAGTLKSTLQGFGVPADKLNDLSILNGMNLDDAVKAGTKIKVVS